MNEISNNLNNLAKEAHVLADGMQINIISPNNRIFTRDANEKTFTCYIKVQKMNITDRLYIHKEIKP